MSAAPAPRPGGIETVLLDAGGVLLDLDYAYLQRLLLSKGFVTDTDTLSRCEAVARTEVNRRVREGGTTAGAWRDYFRVLLGHAGAPGRVHEEIIDRLTEAHQRFGLWTVPVSGSVETVRSLRERGFTLGVVSNAEGRVEQDLARAGFEGLLDVVVDSHVVGVAKPDPRIFAIALVRIGKTPDTAVFLGDVPAVDVEGARAAGIAPVLLDRHGLYPDSGVPRLRRIEELPGWLAASVKPGDAR